MLPLGVLLSGACSGAAAPPPTPTSRPATVTPRETSATPTTEDIRVAATEQPAPAASPETGPRGSDEPGFFASVALGEEIYLSRCSPCHGQTGQADGPAAAALEVKPAAFADAEFMRSRTPASFFRTITDGRPPMPAWAKALTPEERWDVQAYEWRLSTSEESLGWGRAIYAARCASCHAEDGRGHGPESGALASAPPDLTHFQQMAERSPLALFQVISQGSGEMPGFGEDLSEVNRWAVTDYVRTFVFRTEVVALPTPTPRLEVSFSRDVLPILLANCTRCHSGEAPPNGLRLDSYEHLIAGSLYTPELQPGRPEDSPLLIFITKGTMPPDAPALSEEEMGIIRRWIEAGANDN